MSSFSLDPSKIKTVKKTVDDKIDKLNSTLDDIFRRATVGPQKLPIAQILWQQLNLTSAEFKMLAKVCERLGDIKGLHADLEKKVIVMNSLENESDWLYSEIGDTAKDIEFFLGNFDTPAVNKTTNGENS